MNTLFYKLIKPLRNSSPWMMAYLLIGLVGFGTMDYYGYRLFANKSSETYRDAEYKTSGTSSGRYFHRTHFFHK